VVWATDNGEAFPSKRFAVQVQDAKKESWETVYQTDSNLSKDTVASFSPREVKKIRVWQEPEGGSSARPNLMWVEQVAISR
jgi:Iap family predicted aminopeptidase